MRGGGRRRSYGWGWGGRKPRGAEASGAEASATGRPAAADAGGFQAAIDYQLYVGDAGGVEAGSNAQSCTYEVGATEAGAAEAGAGASQPAPTTSSHQLRQQICLPHQRSPRLQHAGHQAADIGEHVIACRFLRHLREASQRGKGGRGAGVGITRVEAGPCACRGRADAAAASAASCARVARAQPLAQPKQALLGPAKQGVRSGQSQS